MRSPDAIFDTMTTPVYAGAAIALLLTMRQVERWKIRRGAALKRHGSLCPKPVAV